MIFYALVAAVTASEEGQGISTIPAEPEVDSKGLLMEMVYYVREY
jgi:predicted RNase H-like nuclease